MLINTNSCAHFSTLAETETLDLFIFQRNINPIWII